MTDPPSSSVALSEVAPGEIGAISEMAARIWPGAYGSILPPGQIDHMLAWMYAADQLRKDLDDGIDYLWISGDGHRCGFLGFGPVRPGASCHLHKCYLLPEVQGRGLGSAAMARLFDRLAEAGATSLELRVNRRNAPAIAFYRKNGFLLHGEDCREIGSGFVMDDYLMRRVLGG